MISLSFACTDRFVCCHASSSLHAELKVSVSFEDARRAVSEAKQHTKAKAASVLQASNKAWSDKLAAARAETQQLQEQLLDLQQQRDQLASEVCVCVWVCE